jgi:hypothetical protein
LYQYHCQARQWDGAAYPINDWFLFPVLWGGVQFSLFRQDAVIATKSVAFGNVTLTNNYIPSKMVKHQKYNAF